MFQCGYSCSHGDDLHVVVVETELTQPFVDLQEFVFEAAEGADAGTSARFVGEQDSTGEYPLELHSAPLFFCHLSFVYALHVICSSVNLDFILLTLHLAHAPVLTFLYLN